jgi:hypothetical protein
VEIWLRQSQRTRPTVLSASNKQPSWKRKGLQGNVPSWSVQNAEATQTAREHNQKAREAQHLAQAQRQLFNSCSAIDEFDSACAGNSRCCCPFQCEFDGQIETGARGTGPEKEVPKKQEEFSDLILQAAMQPGSKICHKSCLVLETGSTEKSEFETLCELTSISDI